MTTPDEIHSCDNANVYPDGFAAPERSKFGEGSEFGAGSKFGAWSKFGERSEFGERSKFGAGSEFGEESKFGERSKFGEESKFGADCIIEGVVASRIMTLANVDGSGRQILLIWHAGGVLVRAGCFLGGLHT